MGEDYNLAEDVVKELNLVYQTEGDISIGNVGFFEFNSTIKEVLQYTKMNTRCKLTLLTIIV